MKYKVIDISEEDYGCEGIPEDSELMCSVLIENSDGTQKWLKIADRYLRENDIDIGSVISFIYKLPINCIFIQIDTAKFVSDKQIKPQTKRLRLRKHSGRGRRIRTLGTRFWRPLLYQLSYTPR